MPNECHCRCHHEQQARELLRLQASQRRLWAALVLVPSLLLLVAASRSASVPEVIEAHRFVLLDANGGLSGMWQAGDPGTHKTGSASLIFNSDNGMAAMLTAGDGNP